MHTILLGAKKSYLSALECDLSVLHTDLLAQLDEVAQSQVHNFLSRLGVKSWSPNDVIHNHILPTFQSQKWKVRSSLTWSIELFVVTCIKQCIKYVLC